MTHRPIRSLLLLAALATVGAAPSGVAHAEEPAPPASLDGVAQDDAEESETEEGEEAEEAEEAPAPERQRPPQLPPDARIAIDFVDAPITDVIKHFAEVMGRNFILTDDLKGEITIISHSKVSRSAAWEAFVSALAVEGYTLVTTGNMTKVVPITEAAGAPVGVYEGGNIPYTDNFVTQIIQLDSVAVNDVSSVVKELAGKGANIIAYAPTNTLIISGPAHNIRRVYRIISQLDVAAPKAKLAMVTMQHAEATEVQSIIEKLYGGGESAEAPKQDNRRSTTRNRRNRRNRTPEPATEGASASKVGSEGKYIQQIIADERTNSLLILANEEALKAVVALIEQIDVDVDPTSRAKINVVYLEHAKAEDVAQVLTNLAQSGNNSSSSNRNTRNTRLNRGRAGQPGAPGGAGGEGESKAAAVAAFDSGMRIASDENTNALVVIATNDEFDVISDVIEKLDRRRQQVFVEAVILELSTEDDNSFGLAVHGGTAAEDGSARVGSAQLGASSITGLTGFTSDVLSGMAVGVFGPSFEVDTGTELGSISIPAFGVVLNALQSSSSVNILSTPNILTMDNEEAKIVVGRNVPFPVGTTQNNLGTPIISFQREDVAITLRVTPQINESDYVTLEVFQEVQELESDPSSLDPLTSGGPVTSKRSIENTVVVKDNQTIVLGGLIGETDNQIETKVPILGDIPLVGRLFRGQSRVTRRTNLMVFLTPHIINEPADLEEVYRIKTEQRREFVRRFYGKSLEEQEAEMRNLLSYSMNQVDQPSRFRGPTVDDGKYKVIGEPMDGEEAGTAEEEATRRAGRRGNRVIAGRAVLINEAAQPEEPESPAGEAPPQDEE